MYADSTAVVGPLAAFAEPHSYDLCSEHAVRLTAPKGWDLVRAEGDLTAPGPSSDDILALADAVREAGRPSQREPGVPGQPDRSVAGDNPPATGRRGHLRVLPPSNG